MIIKQEQVGSVLGVAGRFFAVTRYENEQGRIASQKWRSEARAINGYGTNGKMIVEIRFDDDCKNGHESFAITADVVTTESRRQRDIAAGGCLHDEIAHVFPELAPLIKWHLVNAGQPWGYIENTCYFAGDCDCWGKRKGEVKSYSSSLQFGDFPITYTPKQSLLDYLTNAESINNDLDLQVAPVGYIPRKGSTDYKFGPKFTFAGMPPVDWYSAPFDTIVEAEQIASAIRGHGFKIVKTPNAWGEGKDRELDKARESAIWPDAPDEILMLEKDELTKVLTDRLPALMSDFYADIKRIGFLTFGED